jgi:peptide/nickel transport system permease protein
MVRLIVNRLLASVAILGGVSFAVFLMIDRVPGDPAAILAGENATPDQIEALRVKLGLDDPLLVRYGDWLAHAVRGDFGYSLRSGEAVTSAISSPLTVTLALVSVTILISTIVGVGLGTSAAIARWNWIDRVVSAVAAVAIAIPSFWAGMMLVSFFAISRDLLPAVGYVPITEDPVEWISHLILPAIALGMLPAAEMALQVRDSLRTELRRDYVQVARAKGMTGRQVVIGHAAKNAAIPVLTVFGYRAGQLIGGAIAVETVFALPGLGQLAIASTLNRDVNILLGMVVITTLAVITINLIVDVSYGYLNPKMRD